MWIKICGITRLQDAMYAESLGASAIGFIFASSPRQIDAFKAAEISRSVGIAKVGVFVDASLATIQQTVERCQLDYVQMHGNESPDFCHAINVPVIKAFRLKNIAMLRQLKKYNVYRILLDAYVPGQMGGTGVTINNQFLSQIENFSNMILAGGIHAGNVRDFLAYHPFGVDVSSGVESEPGIKDKAKMEKLFVVIREYTGQ